MAQFGGSASVTNGQRLKADLPQFSAGMRPEHQKGEKMKRTLLISMPALSLLAALATAQPRSYDITDLGTLPGGTFSLATYVNNNGLVTGLSTVADGTQHAFLWYKGQFMDIAKPGLGGPNNGAFAVNARAQVLVLAETSTKDPNGENFCGYGTGLTCLPAIWQN